MFKHDKYLIVGVVLMGENCEWFSNRKGEDWGVVERGGIKLLNKVYPEPRVREWGWVRGV